MSVYTSHKIHQELVSGKPPCSKFNWTYNIGWFSMVLALFGAIASKIDVVQKVAKS